MKKIAGVLLFIIPLTSAQPSHLRAQSRPAVSLTLRFYPQSVQAGSSVIASLYSNGKPPSAYLDVRFRSPGTGIDQVALNWQRGTASTHDVPIDTAGGTWLITAIRTHDDPNDHSGDFVPVVAPLTVNTTGRTAGIFAPTARMMEGRRAHTATLLSDGRVLVTGGTGSNSGLRSAEIYDPESATFSPTGMMTMSRWWHTATLLTDGKVLIVGGYGLAPQIESTAELYDPVTGRFRPTGNMTSPQVGHTATLLLDGRVLIVGGIQAFGPEGGCPCLADAELYDPITERFTTVSWPPLPALPTANLLIDGRVFIASGPDTPQLFEGSFGTGQLFDPMTDLFNYVRDPGNVTRYAPISHTGTLLTSGKVLLTGGGIPEAPYTSASAGLFDPMARAFQPVGNMSTRREGHTATLLPDGRVLVTGGGSPSTAEVYDPSTGAFSATGSMTTDRPSNTATLLRTGAVLITGGDGSAGTSELYYPAFAVP